MKEQLQQRLLERVNQCVTNKKFGPTFRCEKIERKKESVQKRNGEIVKAKAVGTINKIEGDQKVHYEVHFQYLIKHKKIFYIEEEIEKRVAYFHRNQLERDEEINVTENIPLSADIPFEHTEQKVERVAFIYDRLQAVKYAERWWNEYNPAFPKFENDCTNFISQCLYAGNAPMRGFPNRSQGWWMRNKSWSYSWTVAHALTNYLNHSTIGLRGMEVKSPAELTYGDVICYDFEGDGRFNHTTIVTGKDGDGMPLVNAHTANSRMRYWAYEDSTAYTPNIKYKFFHIVDDQ